MRLPSLALLCALAACRTPPAAVAPPPPVVVVVVDAGGGPIADGGPGGAAACFVGGCSSQVCSDRPDVVSTCEFRPEYECLRGAQCARQADGRCGWTETDELRACRERARGGAASF